MVRHSKNNTASSAFTKAEYGKLRDVWGSKQIRLGAESMRHFDQCNLCLNGAEGPVTCPRGHLFCKECILSSLLDQKRDIAAVQATLTRLEQEHRLQREHARTAAISRVQQNFERMQSGVGGSSKEYERRSRRSASPSGREARNRSRSPSRSTTLANVPARIAAQTERAIAETMERLSEEQAQAKRDRIPAYWLPSLTPSAETSKQEIVRRTEEALGKGMETKCFVSDVHGHPLSIKSLIDVRFASGSDSEGGERKICPSCKKTLSDVHKLFTLRKCGHVHCSTCVDTLLRPALKEAAVDKDQRPSCLECSTVIKSEQKDLIPLQREGTGFSSAGNNETRQGGISFQG